MTTVRHRFRRRAASWRLLILAVSAAPAFAVPPALYRTPGYQSPVRIGAGQILLLAGSGLRRDDQVIYRALRAGDAGFEPPASVPATSTALLGVAAVVSVDHVPTALMVRMPTTLLERRPYRLWVRTAAGEWSAPLTVNDARPLWFSPAAVYATRSIGSLPRLLKIIGRNLDPAPGQELQVRLRGPDTHLLTAPRAAAASLAPYATSVPLPARLAPGSYSVELRRGEEDWVMIPGQRLEVRSDPVAVREFDPAASQFGGCKPDDGLDDTPCLQRALAAASSAGGTVVLDAGVWNLDPPSDAGPDGLLVPTGVNLKARAGAVAVILRSTRWSTTTRGATFTLQGRNVVSGITFSDARRHAAGDVAQPMLQIGVLRQEDGGRNADLVAPVPDVVIASNRFDHVHTAIDAGGLPVTNLVIADNVFGAFATALELTGNRYNVNRRFQIEDAVITRNTFQPGSYLDLAIGQGAMASELGAGRRVDFSDNVADGSATGALDEPGDARGWRAAYFWNLNDNQDEVLVAGNVATCTGDKDGDGEAIAFDNNGNAFALDALRRVRAADADSLTVDGPLAGRQFGRVVDPATYYLGDWIHVMQGRGLGQARRITGYDANAATGRITLRIEPRWDVVPSAGDSGISIGRQFWQLQVVGNRIDNRRPLCSQGNRTAPKGGLIGVIAQSTDTVVAGNEQHDSDGVLLQSMYSAAEAGCPDCARGVFFNSSVEIRDNLIDGAYRLADGCSSSGIFLSLAASPRSPAVTASFGLAILHNTIANATARDGGAITVQPTWYLGPAPHRWPLVDALLIQDNAITGLDASAARACDGKSVRPRPAIALPADPVVWHVAFAGNRCPDARVAASGFGVKAGVACRR